MIGAADRDGPRARGLTLFGEGSRRSRGKSALVVGALLAVSWLVVYAAGGAKIAPHLFYLPIIVAAGRLGPAGTLATAVLAGLLAGPLLPLDVQNGEAQPLSDWLIRATYFIGIGLFTEYLFRRLRKTESDLSLARSKELLQQQARTELARRLDEERRELLARVVGAQEEERRRIAGDIHDDSIQVMSALRMRLGALRSRVTDPEAIRQLERLETTSQEAIARLRRLMSDLNPWDLDDRGLLETIRRALPEVLGRHGVYYELDGELEEEPPPEVGTAAYRIVREALQNIRKHADAGRAAIVVEQSQDALSIRVTDDGVGFAPAEAQAGHLGLVSMRERAEAVGGRCTITSAPRRGTTVHVVLPLGEAAAVARDLNDTA
ncbi:MAG TPA: sensor histidine kinase [Actinomycetota bacterium]